MGSLHILRKDFQDLAIANMYLAVAYWPFLSGAFTYSYRHRLTIIIFLHKGLQFLNSSKLFSKTGIQRREFAILD